MAATGDVLNGRYQLERVVGRGGFAQVFLAIDVTLKRRVAIKILNAELANDPTFLGRFEDEAQQVARLDHPHILTAYDYGHVGDTAFLVMPYVEGGTLHDRLHREGPLSLTEAAHYLRAAAAALDHAHYQSIVHRDVKPQNMLLRVADDRLLLADFGIARVLRNTSTQTSGAIVGTLFYMAPEQFEGRVISASDVYALGVTLFELLAGVVPYSGSTQQVIYGHVMAPVPSLAERSHGRLPSALDEVMARAMAKVPEERFARASDLADALEELDISGDTGATRRVVVPQHPGVVRPPTPDGVSTGAQPTMLAGAPKRGRLGRRIVLAGIAALGVSSLGLAAASVRNLGALPPSGADAATPQATSPAAAAAPPTSAPPPAAAPTTTQAPATAAVGAAKPTAAAKPSGTSNVPTAAAPPLRSEPPLQGHLGGVYRVAWSLDGQILASASDDRTVRLWDASGKPLTTIKHNDFTLNFEGLAWSPDGTLVTMASKKLQFWQPDGQFIRTFVVGGQYPIHHLSFAPGGQTVTVTGASRVQFIDVASGKSIGGAALHPEHNSLVDDYRSAAWSPDGQLLAAACAGYAGRGGLVVWANGLQNMPQKLQGHTKTVSDVAWAPGGEILASSSEDVRLWARDGTPLKTLDGPPGAPFGRAETVAWAPDDQLLAVGYFNSQIRLWRPDGTMVGTLFGHPHQVLDVAWAPDGKTLASAGDSTVRLWRR